MWTQPSVTRWRCSAYVTRMAVSRWGHDLSVYSVALGRDVGSSSTAVQTRWIAGPASQPRQTTLRDRGIQSSSWRATSTGTTGTYRSGNSHRHFTTSDRHHCLCAEATGLQDCIAIRVLDRVACYTPHMVALRRGLCCGGTTMISGSIGWEHVLAGRDETAGRARAVSST